MGSSNSMEIDHGQGTPVFQRRGYTSLSVDDQGRVPVNPPASPLRGSRQSLRCQNGAVHRCRITWLGRGQIADVIQLRCLRRILDFGLQQIGVNAGGLPRAGHSHACRGLNIRQRGMVRIGQDQGKVGQGNGAVFTVP